MHLQRMVSEQVFDVQRTENLVIIQAQPGTALGIAAAIDAAELPDVLGSLAGNDTILVIAAELPDVLGSLAGNDTILVITRTASDGEQFELMIGKLRSVRK